MASNEDRIDELEERLRTLEVGRAQHDAWSLERNEYLSREITTLKAEKEAMWAEIGKLKWNRALVVAILGFCSSIIGGAFYYAASRAAGTNLVPVSGENK